MTNRVLALALTVYLTIAVVTFGRAWNHQPAERYSWVVGKCLPTVDADRLFAGSLAGLMWPFYWSAVLWAPNDRDVRHDCQDPRTPTI